MEIVKGLSILVIDGPKVLLVHRPEGRQYYGDYTDVVGGNFLRDEMPERAFSREMAEKLQVFKPTILATLQFEVQEADALVHRYGFICTCHDDTIELDPSKYDDKNWYEKGEIPRENLTRNAQAMLAFMGYIR